MWKLVILSWFISTHGYAQDYIPKMIDALTQKFDTEFLQGVGGAAGIVYKGKVVYKKVFGHEYLNGPPISEDTYFPIGSVSKPITALVIADLMAEKKLSLATELKRAIPQAPLGIQVYNLLSHSSGFIFKANPLIEQGRSREFLVEELLRRGTKKQDFLYSNLVFSLLEDIVAHETRDTWPNVFHQTLKKRGLGHLAIGTLPADAPVAYPHAKRRNKFVTLGRFPKNYPQLVSSSAGVFASLKDLLQFAQMQFSPEFEFLHQPRISAKDVFYWGIHFPVPEAKIKASYALGWRVFEHVKDTGLSTRLVYHGGSLNGLSAFVGFMKNPDLAVVVVRNDDQRFSSNTGIDMWTAYLKSASLI